MADVLNREQRHRCMSAVKGGIQNLNYWFASSFLAVASAIG